MERYTLGAFPRLDRPTADALGEGLFTPSAASTAAVERKGKIQLPF